MTNNFLPNVKCPHCGAKIVVAISGFGGELNVREKVCTKCHQPFFVQLLVQTTTNREVTDGQINSYKKSIMAFNKQRNEALATQLVKYEIAKAIRDEALTVARYQCEKNNMN